MPRVLVVDDNRAVAQGLMFALESEQYEITVAFDHMTAIKILKDETIDLVVTDLMVPAKEDGLRIVQTAKAQNPLTQVLVITAYGSIETAVEAMKGGADEFLVKGFEIAELKLKLQKMNESRERELDRHQLRMTSKLFQEDVERMGHYDRLIGETPRMQELLRRIEKAAKSNPRACLIEGETGSGKELVARAIHRLSPRREKPFIAINCAALPQHLVESELFGYEKGAFTGADRMHVGKFELALGGTIFLDEVGEIPLHLQAVLLRILEEREFYRVGGQKPVMLDVMIIAATNRNLAQAVREGKFREDIYHRLNVVSFRTVPLREHADDIPLMVNYFLQRFNRSKGIQKTISPEAMAMLQQYQFPGNVRELKNILDNAMTFSTDDIIEPDELMPKLGKPDQRSLQAHTVDNLKKLMERHNGNVTRAAVEIGYTREGLTKKLKRLGLR